LIAGRVEDFGPLLHEWQMAKGSGPVQQYIRSLLTNDANKVKEFLDVFRSGAVIPGIDQDAYQVMAKFADPQDLMMAFETCSLLTGADRDYRAAMARYFAEIYARSQSAESDTAVS
jgi:hypothetical protein